MKNILITTIILLGFVACDDQLELAPISSISTNSMWQTEEDATAAKYGLYSLLTPIFDNRYFSNYTDMRDGTFTYGAGYYASYGDYFDNTLDPDSDGADWGDFYELINNCNLILKYVPDIDFGDEDEQNMILSEAYFMRAFTYFWMVRIWGDIPVLETPYESDDQDNIYPTRQDASVAFDLIESDLANADGLWPEGITQECYLVNDATIQMLIVDVYLWLYKVEGEDSALDVADAAISNILSNSNYSLEENYSNVFTDEDNSENIFTIYLDYDESGNSWYINTLYKSTDIAETYWNTPVPISAYENQIQYSDSFYELIYEDANDTRAEATAARFTDGSTTWSYGVKYSGEYGDDGVRRCDQDMHVYRFAETLLMKAEIEGSKGNTATAAGYLNQVAKRAYGVEDYYTTSLSSSELDAAIVKETRKEFGAEARSWWAMTRFDVVFDLVSSLQGRETEEGILLWPVSYETINDNSNITQTPGYE